jgi:hypothetical protein
MVNVPRHDHACVIRFFEREDETADHDGDYAVGSSEIFQFQLSIVEARGFDGRTCLCCGDGPTEVSFESLIAVNAFGLTGRGTT